MVHGFNPRSQEADLCEFEISLVYRESSRTARIVTQKNPVQEKKKSKKEKQSQ